MKKSFAILAMLAGVGLAAQASDRVGVLGQVKGNISVGGNGFISKAENGTPLRHGSTVLVSASGSAVVELDAGCVIGLKGGQHLTIDSRLSCSEQQAAVRQMFEPYRVAQIGIGSLGSAGGAGAAGAGIVGPAILGGIVLTGNVAVNTDRKNSGS